MKMANLSEVKDKLSQFVDQVRDGETVRILVHGRAVADLVPVSRRDGWDEAELAELERLRIVRRADLPPDDELLRERPIVPKGGAAASRVLIAERRCGR